MINFNNQKPQKILGKCLYNAWKIDVYKELVRCVKNGENVDRDKYKGFYRFRKSNKKILWYDKYFSLLAEQTKTNRGFQELLEILNATDGGVDPSYVSKLMATANPDLPIWDSNVLRNMGYDKEWNSVSGKDKTIRIKKAVEIYEKIKKETKEFLKTDECKALIDEFDNVMPKSGISRMKKLDFVLYGL